MTQKCKSKLAVIVISDGNESDLKFTLRESDVLRTNMVLSILVCPEPELLAAHQENFDVVLEDERSGVYQAMNLGLSEARRLQAEFVVFCNAGDGLRLEGIDMLTSQSCYVTDLEVFRGDPIFTELSVSSNQRIVECARGKFRHPGFIAPIAMVQDFDCSLPISADQKWMRSITRDVLVKAIPGRAVFGAGGLSTEPSVKLAAIYFFKERNIWFGSATILKLIASKLSNFWLQIDFADRGADVLKFVATFVRFAGRRQQSIYVLSNGRSGSTLIYNAIAESFAKKIGLPKKAITRTDWKFSQQFSNVGVFKSHRPCPKNFLPKDNTKYIYVAGCPKEATASLVSRFREFGSKWMVKHALNLGVDPSAVFFCLQTDSFGLEYNVESWRRANEANPDRVMFLYFDEIWDRLSDLESFLNLEIELPPRRDRNSASSPKRKEVMKRLEQFFD
jgi:hypothetical protein